MTNRVVAKYQVIPLRGCFCCGKKTQGMLTVDAGLVNLSTRDREYAYPICSRCRRSAVNVKRIETDINRRLVRYGTDVRVLIVGVEDVVKK